MFHTRIVDDRGRVVPLVPNETPASLRSDPERDRRLTAVQNVPRRPVQRRDIARGVLWGVVLIPVLLVAALAPAWMAFGLKWPWWGQILSAIPIGVIPPLVIIAVIRRVAGGYVARCYLYAGYCASCGFDLRGIEAQADGCHVCPECGAAWKLTDEEDAASP